MDFAVVKVAGKQYLVHPGDSIEVSGFLGAVGQTLPITEVLLLSLGEDVRIGSPFLDGVKLSAKVEKQQKGEKIDVFKFKAKSRYRRHIGFRPQITKLLILPFGSPGPAEKKTSSKTKPRPIRKTPKS